MKYYKPQEAIEYIQQQWDLNPLKLGDGANATFSTIDGVKKQLDSLYDTKGILFFFVQKNENIVELVPLNLDCEIDRPPGYKILGHEL
jgi:hypothetical protein